MDSGDEGLMLLHSLSRAAAGPGCAAKRRVVTARRATVLELSASASLHSDYFHHRIAAFTRMGADEFSRLAVLVQDLSALYALLNASDPDGLALGAYHRHGVIGFQLGEFLGRLYLIEHHLVLAALHRLHLVATAGVGRAAAGKRQDDHESHNDS